MAAYGRMSEWGHSHVGTNSCSLALNFIHTTTCACPLHTEPGAHTSPRSINALHMVLDAVLTWVGHFTLPAFLAAQSTLLLDLDEAGHTGDIHAVFTMQEATWAYLTTFALCAVLSAGEACYLAAVFGGGAVDV